MRSSRPPQPPADRPLVTLQPPVARPHRPHRRRLGAVVVGLVVAASVLVGGIVTGSAGSGHAAAATPPPHSPYGVAEHTYRHAGGLYFSGWAIDPSAPTKSIRAYVMVDGKLAGQAVASGARPDVARRHPSAGPNHGFKFSVLIREGSHRICVKAHNVGAGANAVLRCQTRTLHYGPLGTVQTVAAAHGQVTVSGWTLDIDNPRAPLTVTTIVDGKASKLVADRPNPATVTVGVSGKNHGFAFVLPAGQGQHTVCVRVTNLGYGSDTAFPCRKITLNDSPLGAVDSAAQSAGKLRLKGWAFDPDSATSPATVLLKVDRTTHTLVAGATRTDVGTSHPVAGSHHGFDVSYALAEGSHTVCATIRNVSFGSDVALPCKTVRLNFAPVARTTSITAAKTGLSVSGWASDPDTSAPVSVQLSLDGKLVRTTAASGTGPTHRGHNFVAHLTTKSGKHTVCAVAVNKLYGNHNSASSCRTITLALNPLGRFDSLHRAAGSADLQVAGWSFDPDTARAVTVDVLLDGTAVSSIHTGVVRTDVADAYPTAGTRRGFSADVPADDGEHTVCLTARNSGGGTDTSLGCKLIIAVHPVAPSAPRRVTAIAGYGGATISWTAPASDGGAPWTKYVVTAAPGGRTATVGARATTAAVAGLKANASYSFTVRAVNVAGASVAVASPKVKTQAGPPPQKSPAPVSTSRYIRNIRSATATERSVMRSEGSADAKANPSGHGYLMLLDIGGQDQYDGGVVLSATTRFVPYASLVRDIESYLDGYHAGQRLSAPAVIAIGTNNDMDVTSAAGRAWADKVVDPLVAYAKRYPGMKIAGANDIEPGFRATYTQTKSWLAGYLGSTSAPFVFNGSADGCAWTTVNRGCNNGWSMAGLYYLAAGAAPTRMINLPQIYNYTMADQWKYISLTGVVKGQPRINFGGTLTEWTACVQANNSCGSISGRTAWSRMWSNLQSDSRLKVGSLPYSTDLRIDR